MHVEENKAIARRYIEEVHNKWNLEFADEIFSNDCVVHVGLASFNKEDYKDLVKRYSSTFPDIATDVDDQIAEADKVVTLWTTRFTHDKKSMGVNPTYRQIIIKGISIYRFVEGRIVEMWVSWDRLSLMQQLGIIHSSSKQP
ncbi:ester cyclase [Desulfobacterota bacterium AH_259_B03_O07]|nr:ester cyclase [Desulfobacterota bacterium AH_259_B03_O07]